MPPILFKTPTLTPTARQDAARSTPFLPILTLFEKKALFFTRLLFDKTKKTAPPFPIFRPFFHRDIFPTSAFRPVRSASRRRFPPYY